MIDFIRKYRVLLAVSVVLITAAVAFSLYSTARIKLLNKSDFRAIYNGIKEASDNGQFTDQQALTDYIVSWAEENNLDCTTDKSGNVIIRTAAVERKKNMPPTVVCVSANYETVSENARLLASAAVIAKSDIEAGRRTVIFVNDVQNTGAGYRGLSKKLFKKKAKVIYMDYGSSAYMSASSFGLKSSEISIKAGKYDPECDTAVKVHISGVDSAIIGTGISKHPDPVSALSTLLTRLKSRSAIYQLADFEIGTNGNMTPVSMDATILLNSYAVPSFTKYIDKHIKNWEKAYGDDYENLEYTYEVIDDPEALPEKTYSRKATARLTNVLYTLKSGIYKYEKNDNIPEGRSEGDIFGINYVTGIRAEEGYICIDLLTQAYDDEYMQKIMDDNTAAAELFDCSISEKSSVPRFLNEKDSLSRTFDKTFSTINYLTSTTDVLRTESDNYFTPCSYLAAKNENADVIHIRMNSDQASILTNTILCYIAYKGNILF